MNDITPEVETQAREILARRGWYPRALAADAWPLTTAQVCDVLTSAGYAIDPDKLFDLQSRGIAPIPTEWTAAELIGLANLLEARRDWLPAKFGAPLMASEPDVEIRYDGTYTGCLCAGYAIVFMAGFYVKLADTETVPPLGAVIPVVLLTAPFVIGLGLLSYWYFTDKAVKLSLTAEGLRDLRTGTFIKWTRIRNVRLYTVYSTKGARTADTMYVMLPSGEECGFDVHSLDRTPEIIVAMVQQRALA